VSIQLIRRTVTIDWPKKVETDGKALLIDTAHNGHKQILADDAAKGLYPTWEAYANHPGNSNLESVVLPGPIVYNYRYLVDLIEFALDELRRQSPVSSGNYKRSHTVYVNDQPVGDTIPKTISASDQIYIANPVPYARRLEVGKRRNGAPFVIQVPNHIYERVAQMVEAEGKGRAKIRMGYVDLGVGTLRRSNRRHRRNVGDAIKSPAIFFQAPI